MAANIEFLPVGFVTPKGSYQTRFLVIARQGDNAAFCARRSKTADDKGNTDWQLVPVLVMSDGALSRSKAVRKLRNRQRKLSALPVPGEDGQLDDEVRALLTASASADGAKLVFDQDSRTAESQAFGLDSFLADFDDEVVSQPKAEQPKEAPAKPEQGPIPAELLIELMTQHGVTLEQFAAWSKLGFTPDQMRGLAALSAA